MSANQPANQLANPFGPRHADPEDLVLYALQFLTEDEAAYLAAHLEQCAECRDELARILGDLAACAFTSDMHTPPAQARQRLMKQVAREKKVIPIAPPAVAAQPVPAILGRSDSNITPFEDDQPKRHIGRTILGWSGWAIAAGLALVATGLHKDRDGLRDTLATQSGQIARLNADAAHAHELMDALTEPSAMRVTLTVKPVAKPQAIGGATYNSGKGSLIFLASNLDPLKMYKVYELWLIPADGRAPIPAVTFRPDDKGNASVIMTDLPKGVPAKAFGVTVEDEGGSQTPTLPIIMAGS